MPPVTERVDPAARKRPALHASQPVKRKGQLPPNTATMFAPHAWSQSAAEAPPFEPNLPACGQRGGVGEEGACECVCVCVCWGGEAPRRERLTAQSAATTNALLGVTTDVSDPCAA